MRLPCIAFAAAAIGVGFAQTKPPSFEAASLKASTGNETSRSNETTTGRLVQRNQTLHNLIAVAFDVKDYQVTGGPNWMDSDTYDVDAKASGPAGETELYGMLQTLLAERFHLEVHREKKPFPGFALVVDKNGIKAQKAADPEHASRKSSFGTLTAKAQSMDGFAQWLERRISAPVADETRLSDAFDFILHWNPALDRSLAKGSLDTAAASSDPKSQPLPVALEEQLGLKLQPRKVPVEMIVVDRAEKPTLN